MKRLYLLTRKDNEPGSYDEAYGFVVVAESPFEARKLAAGDHGDEGEDLWLSADRSRLTRLADKAIDKKSHIVLRDFLSG